MQTYAIYDVPDGRCLRLEGYLQGEWLRFRVKEVYSGYIVDWFTYKLSHWLSCPVERRYEVAKGILARLATAQTAKPKGKTTAEAEAQKRWPCLVELLTVSEAPDGSERERSKLTVLWEEGTWKAGVTEPGLEMSAWASSPTLEGLLDALERRLASEDPDTWRKWAGAAKTRLRGSKRA